MIKTNPRLTQLFKNTLCLLTLLLTACVSGPLKYLEIQQEIDQTNLYIQQKEKTIHDLEAYIALNQKAAETLEQGESIMLDGKSISLIEARKNIQNAQALLPAMQSDRDQLIEKRKSLNRGIKDQTTNNSGLI